MCPHPHGAQLSQVRTGAARHGVVRERGRGTPDRPPKNLSRRPVRPSPALFLRTLLVYPELGARKLPLSAGRQVPRKTWEVAGPRQRGHRIAEARLRRAAADRCVVRAYHTSPERGHAQDRALSGADVNDRLLTTRQVADYLGFTQEMVLRRLAGETPRGSGWSNVLRFRESAGSVVPRGRVDGCSGAPMHLSGVRLGPGPALGEERLEPLNERPAGTSPDSPRALLQGTFPNSLSSSGGVVCCGAETRVGGG